MIDGLNLKLINLLQKNGRESYLNIARMLGVAEGTIRKRVKDLVSSETLRIEATLNVRKLGYDFMGIVGIQVRMARLRKVADDLARNPNVCYLVFVTGRYDLVAIVITRSSGEFSQFMEKEISAIPGILRTETFVSLDTIKGRWMFLDTAHLINNLDISPTEIDTRKG